MSSRRVGSLRARLRGPAATAGAGDLGGRWARAATRENSDGSRRHERPAAAAGERAHAVVGRFSEQDTTWVFPMVFSPISIVSILGWTLFPLWFLCYRKRFPSFFLSLPNTSNDTCAPRTCLSNNILICNDLKYKSTKVIMFVHVPIRFETMKKSKYVWSR
jgi:hypothetical protein